MNLNEAIKVIKFCRGSPRRPSVTLYVYKCPITLSPFPYHVTSILTHLYPSVFPSLSKYVEKSWPLMFDLIKNISWRLFWPTPGLFTPYSKMYNTQNNGPVLTVRLSLIKFPWPDVYHGIKIKVLSSWWMYFHSIGSSPTWYILIKQKWTRALIKVLLNFQNFKSSNLFCIISRGMLTSEVLFSLRI